MIKGITLSSARIWQEQEDLTLKIQLTLFTSQERKLDLALSRSALNNLKYPTLYIHIQP